MKKTLWSLDELVRFTRFEDPEVRYWAVDRLIRHHPDRCCEAISGLLFDDHDATPSAVARHLGEHGGAAHHALLVRGFRVLRGQVPAQCLHSLTRLDYAEVIELAASALKRGDLSEAALASIVESISGLNTTRAGEVVRDYVSGKAELLTEPACMRGVLRVVDHSEIPQVLTDFVGALAGRGAHRAGEAFRTLMDSLQIDDAAWCFRTGPSGHIELRKTIKAVESGYDCDISNVIGKTTINQIAQRFRAGNLAETIRSIAEWTVRAAPGFPAEPGSDLPTRIASAVGAFTRKDLLEAADRLGHHFQQWLLGFQLSAAFAVARGQNFAHSLRESRGDLDRLLELAEYETSFLPGELPEAIAAVCRDNDTASRKAQDWCLRMLEAQGPFFPKIVALRTLGELESVHFIPEIMDYLSDENSYVYGAAERALSRLGETIIGPAVSRIETNTLDPDAAHSILVLLCDMGTRQAYDAVTRHLDWFMDAVGPGTAAEWVSLFGTEELIDPMREWLDQDPAMIGQGLLLLGAIHSVPIPEEEEILRAIEDARARHGETLEDEGLDGGPEPEDGGYVM